LARPVVERFFAERFFVERFGIIVVPAFFFVGCFDVRAGAARGAFRVVRPISGGSVGVAPRFVVRLAATPRRGVAALLPAAASFETGRFASVVWISLRMIVVLTWDMTSSF